MKKHFSILCISLFFVVLIPAGSIAQNFKEKAETYFNKHQSKNAMNTLILKSLPDLADVKKIFIKEEHAKQFMLLIESLEKQMKAQAVGEDEEFPKIEINTFTLKEIKKGEAHYNQGLLKITDKFDPKVRFYSVRLMRESEIENGYSYIYWMNVNSKWVFISKPQQAFK
jgi:hypothetical protein